ncbi:hypothetical protein Dimus_016151, partial [Dionaea muscipula]
MLHTNTILIRFGSLHLRTLEQKVVEIQSPPRASASSGGVDTFRVGSSTESSPNSSRRAP